MDQAASALLQDLVRKEGRSLLQYVNECNPWTTAKTQAFMPRLKQMVKEEQEAATGIVRFLMKRRQRPPYLGAYPTSFTNINFIALESMLPYLVDYQKERIAEIEKDLAALTDPEVRSLVYSLWEMKRRHLAVLQEMSHG
ncbi:MAG: hypothetical protein L0215_27610 [Gemmataceae bacterium]|nr:hypothetical protein [Gemmataceae bacterium]